MPFEPTVFIIDDDEAVRESIALLLESENLHVEAYAAAESFLEAYRTDRPGCLVLDISMPGMTGLELQETLRAKQVEIPIIFVTGHGDVTMSVKALKAGAFDFIEKPFNDEALLGQVSDAIAWDLRYREKQARKVAEAVSAYAESIVETVREPLLVLDNNLTILSANRAFYKTFQIPVPKNETPALAEFAEALWSITALKQRMQTLVGNNTELNDFEIMHAFPIVGQKHLRINAQELRQASNQAKRFLLAIEDITQRKLADERFRVLLENAPDALVIVNNKGEIILANEQMKNTFGYTKEELIGQSMEILLPQRYRDKHITHRDRYFFTPNIVPMGTLRNLSGMRKDGSEFPIEVSLSPYETPEGMQVLSAIRDVTERQMIEEELRQHRDHLEELVALRTADLEASNKELESYSYSIAHDLRAPLRSIVSFSQILQEDTKDLLTSEDLDHLRRVISAGKRMSRLIDEILELSRITRTELHYEPVNLSKLSHEILYQLRHTDPEKQVKWTVHDNLNVIGDARLLEVALQNLIENAWKYTRDTSPAHIEIGSESFQGETAYFVKDNGVGFHMEHANKLFKPFHRLHSPKEYEGTGIGLATVQRIIQRHGGRVWAKSVENQGATFYFTLPTTKPV
jgi:PAS domain S-box-containing protein